MKGVSPISFRIEIAALLLCFLSPSCALKPMQYLLEEHQGASEEQETLKRLRGFSPLHATPAVVSQPGDDALEDAVCPSDCVATRRCNHQAAELRIGECKHETQTTRQPSKSLG